MSLWTWWLRKTRDGVAAFHAAHCVDAHLSKKMSYCLVNLLSNVSHVSINLVISYGRILMSSQLKRIAGERLLMLCWQLCWSLQYALWCLLNNWNTIHRLDSTIYQECVYIVLVRNICLMNKIMRNLGEILSLNSCQISNKINQHWRIKSNNLMNKLEHGMIGSNKLINLNHGKEN